MHDTVFIVLWISSVVVFSFMSYRAGVRSTRREIIGVFNGIIYTITDLAVHNKIKELVSFLSEICNTYDFVLPTDNHEGEDGTNK